jgi:hypothetical protein
LRFRLATELHSHTQSLIVWEFVMDLSFATAVRNASNAWGNNRVTDAATMAELTKRQFNQQELNKALSGPTAGQMAVIQPELARYGQVGTRLNLSPEHWGRCTLRQHRPAFPACTGNGPTLGFLREPPPCLTAFLHR